MNVNLFIIVRRSFFCCCWLSWRVCVYLCMESLWMWFEDFGQFVVQFYCRICCPRGKHFILLLLHIMTTALVIHFSSIKFHTAVTYTHTHNQHWKKFVKTALVIKSMKLKFSPKYWMSVVLIRIFPQSIDHGFNGRHIRRVQISLAKSMKCGNFMSKKCEWTRTSKWERKYVVQRGHVPQIKTPIVWKDSSTLDTKLLDSFALSLLFYRNL